MNPHRQRPAFPVAEGGLAPGETLDARARDARGLMPALPPAGPGLLVALDLDGTLLWHDGSLSPVVRECVRALQAAGAHVVPATGRSTIATLPVALALGLDETWVVCSNGAMIGRLEREAGDGAGDGARDPDVRGRAAAGDPLYEDARDEPEYDADGAPSVRIEVTDRHTFDPRHALTTLRRELPDAMYAVEADSGFKVNRPFPPDELAGEPRVVPFEELWSEPVSRLTLREPRLGSQDFHDLVACVGLHGVGYAVGWTAWLDISPEGITKATALEEVRTRLGVERAACVAVGDGDNDLEMLAWAAHGVAMGNAAQNVRDVADAVTSTVAEDGAAVVLRALLLGD